MIEYKIETAKLTEFIEYVNRLMSKRNEFYNIETINQGKYTLVKIG